MIAAPARVVSERAGLVWALAVRGFRRHATYRAATAAGLVTNVVFGLLRGAVLVALFDRTATVAGWDRADVLTYVWATQGLLMVVHLWGWVEVAERIRSGDIATDLHRPVDPQLWYLAQDLGRAAYHLLTRGIPPVVVGAALFDLRLPGSVGTWAWTLAAVAVAVVVSFGVRWCVNLAAFWVLDWRGVYRLVSAVQNLLSGFVIPVVLFPGWLEALARWSPFVAVVQTPVEALLGRAGPAGLLTGVAWAVALGILGHVMLVAATRRIVVHGG